MRNMCATRGQIHQGEGMVALGAGGREGHGFCEFFPSPSSHSTFPIFLPMLAPCPPCAGRSYRAHTIQRVTPPV